MPPIDKFQKDKGMTSPPERGFAITPSDSESLPSVTRAIFVGTTGHLRVLMQGDTETVLLMNLPSGSLLPIRAAMVYATDTTADDLVGLY